MMAASGSTKCPFCSSSGLAGGSFSRGSPFSPLRRASKSTMIQMPEKYSSAGISATSISCE